jgi:transposase
MPSNARERELNDRRWARVKPLLPPPTPKPYGGRPRADDRACFEGIVFVLRNGLRWKDVPAERLPSGTTCWRRHAEWTGDGVWEGAWRAALDELAAAGRLDPSELYLDCTFAPAQKGGTRSASPRLARA